MTAKILHFPTPDEQLNKLRDKITPFLISGYWSHQCFGSRDVVSIQVFTPMSRACKWCGKTYRMNDAN